MTNPDCPCGTAMRSIPADENLVAHQCQGCGYMHTVFIENFDRNYLQSGNHPSAYQGQDGRRFGSLIGQVRHYCAAARVRLALLGRSGPRRIIDFGCGQGYFLDALKSAGHHCVGIEINELTARSAIGKGHQVAASVEQLDGWFDAVASVHVLEHIPEPERLLKSLGEKLSGDRRFYFEVPNFDSWQARLFGFKWLHCEAGLHVHHYTAKSFVAALANQGYQVERLGTYSFEHGLLGWVQSMLNVVFPYNRFFRNVILNRPLVDKLKCLPELLLMPALIPFGLFCLLLEALANKGAVLRVEGHYGAGKP
jgi:SAM-dependent methyltransferase